MDQQTQTIHDSRVWQAGEWEEELLAVLKGVGDAINPDCEFHRFNADVPAPSEYQKVRAC